MKKSQKRYLVVYQGVEKVESPITKGKFFDQPFASNAIIDTEGPIAAEHITGIREHLIQLQKEAGKNVGSDIVILNLIELAF